MQAAVEEAHAAGKTANAHAHGAEGIKRAAAAGVDSIEHCYFIDREGIDMMLARSTVLVATSAAVRNVVSYGVAAGIPPHIAEKAESAIHAHVSGFKAAHKAGVRLAMGTDSGVPFTRHGSNLDELQHLVEMGLVAAGGDPGGYLGQRAIAEAGRPHRIAGRRQECRPHYRRWRSFE